MDIIFTEPEGDQQTVQMRRLVRWVATRKLLSLVWGRWGLCNICRDLLFRWLRSTCTRPGVGVFRVTVNGVADTRSSPRHQ